MVRTDQSYINQYLKYDLVFEACDACERACIEADYLLRKSQRDAYLNSFFEASLFGKKKDPVVKKADDAEDNFFAKIGKAISDLIKKITDFIKDIGAAITGKQRDIDADTKAVNKIIAENPELKNTIVKGIKKEWFTKHDVAAYKSDIVGLINMLDQGKIDNETALDKFSESTKKFMAGAKDAAIATLTISGVMKLAGNVNSARKENKSLINDLRDMTAKVKQDAEDNNKDPKSISTKLKILTNGFKVLVGLDRDQEKKISAMQELGENIQQVQDTGSVAVRQKCTELIKEQRTLATELISAAENYPKDNESKKAYGHALHNYDDVMKRIDQDPYNKFIHGISANANFRKAVVYFATNANRDQNYPKVSETIEDLKMKSKFLAMDPVSNRGNSNK